MFTDKLKELIGTKEGESNKKKIENLVVFIIILLITIIVINNVWNGNSEEEVKEPASDKNKKLASSTQTIETSSNISEDTTARNLEEILSNISGVGKVKVMLTYSQTSKTVPLYNQDSSERNTEETDKQGGSRKVTESDTKTEIIYKEENGEKVPITQSIVSPVIEGAIVTAEGAGDINVKTNIIQAVEAVTSISKHKIQVFEMSQN